MSGNKSILVSGFFPDEKIELFEELDSYLREYGINLVLQEQWNQVRTSSSCEIIPTPVAWSWNKTRFIRGFKHCDELVPEFTPGRDMLPGEKLTFDDVYSAVLHDGAFHQGTGNSTILSSILKIKEYKTYLKRLLEDKEIDLCLIWHPFTGRNHLLAHLCRQLDIPYLFMEFGSLPGTIVFEAEGGMAESRLVRSSSEFAGLPVTTGDLHCARMYLENVRESALNRPIRKQVEHHSIKDVAERARNDGQAIIFYAGQNDWGSGIHPQPWPRRNIHSSLFTDTFDALGELARIAEKNNWLIIFKPHPYVKNKVGRNKLCASKHVRWVEDADLFECIELSDVCTTILSQTAYHFLIREKPAVVLGKLQLSGKGCAWEPECLEDVEEAFKDAIARKNAKQHQEMFVKHVAQLMKYNLFTMCNQVNGYFGRDLRCAAGKLSDHVLTKRNFSGFPFDEQGALSAVDSLVCKSNARREMPSSGNMSVQEKVERRLVLFGTFNDKDSDKSKVWFGAPEQRRARFRQIILIENSTKKYQAREADENAGVSMCRFPKSFSDLSGRERVSDDCISQTNKYGRCVDQDDVNFVVDWELYWHLGGTSKPKILAGIDELVRLCARLGINDQDLIVVFGSSPVGYLLRRIAEKVGCKTAVSEYGELPNSILVSEKGIFNESWPSEEGHSFNLLPVSGREKEEGRKLLGHIRSNRTLHTHRKAKRSDSFSRKFAQISNGPVIYVNGVDPFSSGLIPRSSLSSKRISPLFATNQQLLNAVARIGRKFGWHVLYKNHPLILKGNSEHLVKSQYDNVYVLNDDVDLHEILDVADVTVSIASKTIMFSLVRGVPVYVPGKFTIPNGALRKGYLQNLNVERSICELLSSHQDERVDIEGLATFVARLRKYYLYFTLGVEGGSVKSHNSIWGDLFEYMVGNRSRVSVPDECLGHTGSAEAYRA